MPVLWYLIRPSKVSAVVIAIVFGMIAVFWFALNTPVCGGFFLILALVYVAIWFLKMNRDATIVQNAARTRYIAEPTTQLTPPKTSKDISRLFVPPPLES